MLTVAGIAQDVELYIEQFLELQPILCLAQQFGIRWEMNLAKCFRQRHQMMGMNQCRRKSLGQRFVQLLQQSSHQFLNCMRIEQHTLHLLRRVVVGLHSQSRELQLRCRIDVGMGDVNALVEEGGFAEYNVLRLQLVLVQQVFDTLKPDQVYHTRSIGEVGHQPALTSLAYRLEAKDFASQLYVGHRAVYLADGVDAAAVDVLVREIVQQVLLRRDSRLLAKYGRPLRPDARQELDVACGQIEHVRLPLKRQSWPLSVPSPCLRPAAALQWPEKTPWQPPDRDR